MRAILNYGHTFAHALEAAQEYGEILHGEAVSIGMVCAARLAVRLGRVSPDFFDRQKRLLERFELPVTVPTFADPDELLRHMRHDKKVADGNLRFVLPTRLGHVELVGDVPEDLVHAAWMENDTQPP